MGDDTRLATSDSLSQVGAKIIYMIKLCVVMKALEYSNAEQCFSYLKKESRKFV